MASQAVSKGSKRIKLSPNSDEKDDVNSCTTGEQGQSSVDMALDKKTVESSDEQNSKSTKKDSELVVISSSSSDDDSDKELKTDTVEPVVKKEEAETFPDVVKSKLQVNQTESLEQDSKQIKVATEPKVERKDSDLDECISQEDLLAQLGLSSVKELNKKETSNMENSTPSANANGVERKPLISHRAKESIVEFLKIPKLSSLDSRKKNNGEVKGDVKITNGNTSDGSRPDSPLSDENDDDLQAKEKLIAHLRNELKQEEAKLLLLKQLHAAQNDVKGSSKFQKENMEKVQTQGASSQPVKSSMQLPPKKGQNLPPPPPLKASTVLATSTFHPPRDVPGQPRLLPKGSSNAQSQSSNSGSSKFLGPAAQTLKEFAVQQSIHQHSTQSHSKPGSSAIADLQNVVTCMANLIQPTPLYPHSGGRGSPAYSAANQPAPVRPTPVRANNVSSLPASSGYVSFQHHLPSSSHQQSPGGKQAAAKMALRKQLERTLLQIPPPKPPPPEWSFIPSLGSQDFMLLVGLESVVDVMAAKEAKGKHNVPLREQLINPKVCSRCNTDFSPSWTNKPGKDSELVTVCEKCSTVNVKKELKAEHTARLKAAFLKALKQEQEIEQKINDTPQIAPKPHHQSQKSSPQPPLAPAPPRHHIAHHQPIMHHHHQPVQPALYHHHQPHTNSLLFQLQQQHLQQQHQELEAAARQQADVRWHPYISQHHHSGSRNPQHHHSYVSDSDRQYLLDMIPSLPTPTLGYGSSRI
ncbi:hypothetical protein pdam_00000065 [Pocillopora damicornis]|uniref:Transcriptional repressor p66 coiled-coil MBD2-interaction domain-containing protein n=1 Tax=Pocillopora damicornis TaxID=46731 RepID=A0A3M6UXJ7_POCDA|nr:transcriptional repressor p66-alpha-like [Pocillopora damicornis]XP_027056658.1 transcriptional repressor p66-alpha-like [Pocillopora damicornis]RMX58327.1 hypothetical protein pdam_00000065 [Pocillopora damicornis]